MSHLLFSLPWGELLLPKPSWAEKLLRPFFVYIVLLLIFRIGGKRALVQATLFDFLVLLMISNVVQNAMIGDDNSVLGAAGGAIVLVVLSDIFNRITAKNKAARHLLEGKPVLLIHSGNVDDQMMQKQAVSRGDLFLAIRKQGISRLADVGFAILELDGSISIIRAEDDNRPHDCLPIEIVPAESKEDSPESSEEENIIEKQQDWTP